MIFDITITEASHCLREESQLWRVALAGRTAIAGVSASKQNAAPVRGRRFFIVPIGKRSAITALEDYAGPNCVASEETGT